MATRKSKKTARPFAEMLPSVANRLRPPVGIILGSPGEVAELAHKLPPGEVVCYQMDRFQAERLTEALRVRGRDARVETLPDLWDLSEAPLSRYSGRGAGGEGRSAGEHAPTPEDSVQSPHPQPLSHGERGALQTLLYPVAYGGERELKLDMIEQAYHALKPQGTLIVLSPYDKDDFFPKALKKIFGKVHAPMDVDNAIFWCQRDGERPRRRHEMNYHVRVDAETSYNFVSRPGVFGYGYLDEGARALSEALDLTEGQRILDIGCGVGAIGILAARRIGPTGFVAFADSNVRAVALADLNARSIGVPHYEAVATHTLTEWPDASFDAVLANPPYYAQGSIIGLFIERARALLRPGGQFYLVTKQTDTTWGIMQEYFPEPELFENRGYVIFRARI